MAEILEEWNNQKMVDIDQDKKTTTTANFSSSSSIITGGAAISKVAVEEDTYLSNNTSTRHSLTNSSRWISSTGFYLVNSKITTINRNNNTITNLSKTIIIFKMFKDSRTNFLSNIRCIIKSRRPFKVSTHQRCKCSPSRRWTCKV